MTNILFEFITTNQWRICITKNGKSERVGWEM